MADTDTDTGQPAHEAHAWSQGRSGLAAAALAGVLAGAAVLGIGELVAALVDPDASPFFVAGSTVVDHTPQGLREAAIRRFGTHDKDVLFASMGIVMLILAALSGVLERRWRIGSALFVVLGVAIGVAALQRPAATGWFVVPTIFGVVAGLIVLRLLVRSPVTDSPASRSTPRSGAPPELPQHDTTPPAEAAATPGLSRRGFMGIAVGVGVVAVGAAAVGRYLSATVRSVTEERGKFMVPQAVSPAPAPTPAMTRAVPGLTEFVTPNDEFYRIDTALQVPAVSGADWSLRIHGMVDRTVEFTMEDLRRRPAVSRMVTLTCVSNEVGGDLAGNAVWTGYRLADLLREAGIHGDADMVLSRSADGFTAGTPLEALTDGRDALLAVGMNGAPLPLDHGYPARMVVPGLYGYVSATKWVVDLEVTRFDRAQAYWTTRGWSERGPIKTASRIDVPAGFATLTPGPVTVAGVAWAQHRGIEKVEIQVDDGPWQPADLTAEYSTDTWRQWTYRWDATPGTHTLHVRATDTTGATQTEQRRPPVPDGATGWHSRTVRVR